MARESLTRSRQVVVRPNGRGKARQKSVRSIQRLPWVSQCDSQWISTEYMRWLPQLFRSLIQVRTHEETGMVRFHVAGVARPLLELKLVHDGNEHRRTKFHIVGGLLSATSNTGWLEFRQVQNGKYTLSAIHEFVPSLPWLVYRCTQAPIHAWVMSRFAAHLMDRQYSQSVDLL